MSFAAVSSLGTSDHADGESRRGFPLRSVSDGLAPSFVFLSALVSSPPLIRCFPSIYIAPGMTMASVLA